MIVWDTNALAALTLDLPLSRAAEKAWRSDRLRVTSPLWRSEMRSVLLKHVWKGLLTEDAAARAFRETERRVKGIERAPDTRLVLREAVRRPGLSSYDGVFVALAVKCGGIVVSSDSPLARVAPDVVVRLSSFMDA